MAAGDVTAKLTKVRAFSSNVFDMVDDYVEVAHDARQLGANLSNGFTLSAWALPRSYGETNGRILDKTSDTFSANGFALWAGSVGFPIAVLRLNTGTQATSAATTMPYGVWTHVIVTVSSAQRANFYINGVLSGSANQNLVQALSTITTTNAMRIGNRAGATDRTWDGGLKDVKMWNRVLTAAEIAEEYAGTTPMSGLLHWFKLGGDYADYGSVGVTATNSGSVPFIEDDALAAAVKAQRVASTDKWMIYRGQGGQVGTVNIE